VRERDRERERQRETERETNFCLQSRNPTSDVNEQSTIAASSNYATVCSLAMPVQSLDKGGG